MPLINWLRKVKRLKVSSFDLRLRRALSVTPNVSFYRYQVSFKLIPS